MGPQVTSDRLRSCIHFQQRISSVLSWLTLDIRAYQFENKQSKQAFFCSGVVF